VLLGVEGRVLGLVLGVALFLAAGVVSGGVLGGAFGVAAVVLLLSLARGLLVLGNGVSPSVRCPTQYV
jgi:hypothetical protein